MHRDYTGPEFLRDGFRPLFLAAGLWAAISGPLWIGVWSGAVRYPGLFDPVAWHIHEMLFGFVAAALGGFLLTAIPNWTGRQPLRGRLLGVLASVWLAGQVWDRCLGGHCARARRDGGHRPDVHRRAPAVCGQ